MAERVLGRESSKRLLRGSGVGGPCISSACWPLSLRLLEQASEEDP